MLKITVVTPSFNQKPFVRQTLLSVLGQTYSNIEYIVVDGGSTDGSVDVINGYSDQIDKIIVEPDEGQADAINKGFTFATGDIFAYLNSDDYYFQDTIEKVAETFERYPEVDVIYGDCVFTDVDGQFLQYFTAITDFDKSWLINNSDIIMQPATFWRRSAFEKYGPFDKNLHFGFDWALWCEFAVRGCRFMRLGEVLAANRVYGSTKTSSGSHERLAELKIINQRYKTTWLPHAYYCFSFVEYLSQTGKGAGDYLRILLYGLLSYENILRHIFCYSSKILYGVLPKTRFLSQEASIRLPRLAYNHVELRLTVPSGGEQNVTVFSNDEKIGCYSFEQGALELVFPLSCDSKKDVDVKFVFEKKYRLPDGFIKSMVLFDRPRRISAVLDRFRLS